MRSEPIKKKKKCEYRDAEIEFLTEDAPIIEQISNRLFKIRKELPAFEYVTTLPRPSFQAAELIISLARQIIFPGFFERKPPTTELNIKYSIGQTLSCLFDLLTGEITSALRHAYLRYDRPCRNCQKQARTIALDVLKQLPDLRLILASDVKATKDGDPAAGNHLDQIIFCYPGVYATMVYRLAHELWLRDVPFIPRIMTESAHTKTGIDIHPGASIGDSFFIDHGTGVVVGETTIIGRRVRIYQGVTLGALSLPKNAGLILTGQKRHPTLEDDVIVYSGATILGGQTIIGARSVIGGNVWLTDSVPPDTKVIIKNPELIIINSKNQSSKKTESLKARPRKVNKQLS